ncbi:MAG: hypothetical protein HYV97_12615 [Bdellovibrio sp.]|nr:hypothetical protein [Bdellovibrio sp.]
MARKTLKQAPFKKLLKQRSVQKIDQINSTATRLLFWNDKISFEGDSVNHKQGKAIWLQTLFCGEEFQHFLIPNQNFSISFKHGLHYFFAQACFVGKQSEYYIFEIFNNQIYKLERRKNDRLRLFPYKKLEIVHGQRKNMSNVFSLRGNSLKSDGINFCFPIFDIGHNGLSFLAGLGHDNYFEAKKTLHDLYLTYNNAGFEITGAQIVYNIEFIDGTNQETHRRKIGINIINPHENPLKWFFEMEKEPYVSEEERVLFQRYIISL